MYLYSNIVGTFVFNQNFNIREKILFTDEDSFKYYKMLKEGKILPTEERFLKKFKNITNLRKEFDESSYQKIQKELSKYDKELYKKNIYITKRQISESVTFDNLIVQTSDAIDEITKTTNTLVKRLREWYSFLLPEVENEIHDNRKFAEIVVNEDRDKLLRKYKVKTSMGKELSREDKHAIVSLASTVLILYEQKESKEIYLDKLMKKHCPNLSEVAGVTIGAKLMSLAGSLREMVMMPASTIQLLGAEKALFRHMRNKNVKPPKHGIIHEHPLLQKSKDKGKAARTIADKICLAVKVDYFKGDFIGDKLRKQVEEKI